MHRPTFASLASITALLLTACPSDDDPSVDTESMGSSTSGGTNITLTLTDPMMTQSDTGSESTSPGTGTEGSSTAVADDTSSGTSEPTGTTDATTGEPQGVWMADFASDLEMDPEDDDQGPGTYSYPMGVDDGSSDLRSFELTYTAADEMLHFTLGLTSITDNTRISLMLLDDPAWANAGSNVVFTVGGTEVRAPNWNDTGVQLVLMDPDSTLFDYGAVNDLDPFSDNPRPDNAIYLSENDGAPFLGADGMPSYTIDNVHRLDVTVDTLASPNTLSFDIDANVLAPHLDTDAENLYVAIWTYTLIELPMDQWFQIEFGAVEVTEDLGGLPNSADANWRDCDAYDVMFFDGAYTQEDFLDVPEMFPGDAVDTVVAFENVGEGVLQIPTGM
jgi:hypothetical protein